VFDDFSITLVVYTAFLISGKNLKNGIISAQRFCQDLAIIGYLASQTPANSSKAQAANSADGERYIFFKPMLVCGPLPEGHARWSLQLLEDTRVTVDYTGAMTVSRETIRQTLNPGKVGNGVSPGSKRRVRNL
jgi:hypothetical protein